MFLVAPAGWKITHNVTTANIQGGVDYTCDAGDRLFITKDNNNIIQIQVFRQNGTAVVSMPTGSIIDFSGSSPPSGFLTCPIAQTNISRTTYAALFAAIGTLWGAGDGSTTFGMPWFPADYVASQANANVGTQTVGQNLAHTHLSSPGNQTQLDSNSVGGGSSANGQSGSSGGTANLAAGVRLLKCVKF